MRKLELEIRRFIYKINPKIKVVFHDEKPESNSLAQTIFLNIDEFIYKYDDEDAYKKIYKEKGFLFDILQPTFTLLHEIGHVEMIKTYKNPFEELRLYEIGCNNVLAIKNPYKRLKKYNELKLENDANSFAYSFFLHNYDFVKSFDEKVRAML